MKKNKYLILNLIFLVAFAICCNMFFVSNYVVYADDKEDDEVVIEYSTWDGSKEAFYLLDSSKLNSESNPYIIDSANKLAYFASMVSDGYTYENEYFKLTVNIDLGGVYDYNTGKFSGNVWQSIGSKNNIKANSFQGVFDGGNNRIVNMCYYSESALNESYGLFGYTLNATIKNVQLNGYVKCDGTNISLLVGYAENTNFENCNVNGIIYGNNTNVGILAGTVYTYSNINIKNCFVSGEITNSSSGSNVAGAVGVVFNDRNILQIEDINSSVIIIANSVVAGVANILQAIGEVNIENCEFGGVITTSSSNNVGGIAGLNSNALIKDCVNYGNIFANSNNVGGIVGSNSGIIYNCINEGEINGLDYTGGIAGNSTNQITNCNSHGNIIGNNYVAGISGSVLSGEESFDFKCNYNTGAIVGSNYVAGIVAKANVNIKYCFNMNLNEDEYGVVGNNYVAGVVAELNNSNLYVCFNSACVKSNDIASGIIAKFIGVSTKNSIEDFYFIGKILGKNIAGVVAECSNANIKNGYVLATLNFIEEENYEVSGAVAGNFANTKFTNVYYANELCNVPHGTTSIDDDIISTTSNEIQSGKLNDLNSFYYYKQETIDKEHYYDYYPILKKLFFDIYIVDSDNYFVDSSNVQSLSLQGAISKVYNTVVITFVTNCDENIDQLYLKQNVDLSQILPIVSKQGYDFDGWYLDENLTQKLDVKNGLSESATLYAKFVYPRASFPWWIFAIIFVVIIAVLAFTFFVTNRKKVVMFKVDGQTIAPLKIKVGSVLILPKPTKEGYKFNGWYYNEELTKKFELNVMPNINLILFGKFIEELDKDKTSKKANNKLKNMEEKETKKENKVLNTQKESNQVESKKQSKTNKKSLNLKKDANKQTKTTKK